MKRSEATNHAGSATAERRRPARFGAAFLSMGFRPFFLSAALWAALGMALWMLALNGRAVLPTALDPVSWHAHEALFGYLGAVFAGFLLTAVPNWTGRPPIAGVALLGLLGLWVLGRVAVAMSHHLPPWTVMILDLSFLVALGGMLLREIVAARNWRNLVVIALLGAFITGNGLFHGEAAAGGRAASGYGFRIGLATAIMMLSVIGGRIVPAFTRNWLRERGATDRMPAAFGWLDRVALVLTLLMLAVWVAMPGRSGTGYLLLAAGAVQLLRLSRWRWQNTGAEPLVWILHVGYAFVPAGMLAIGAAIVWPGGALTSIAAQHLWMAGAVGVMTLAVMTRATLGHAGRALAAGTGTTVLYALVIASVPVRLLGGTFPESALSLWTLSAILWCAGFAGFVLLYGPLLVGSSRR